MNENSCIFIQIYDLNWKFDSIGSDNGSIHWRIFVSLGLNELQKP